MRLQGSASEPALRKGTLQAVLTGTAPKPVQMSLAGGAKRAWHRPSGGKHERHSRPQAQLHLQAALAPTQASSSQQVSPQAGGSDGSPRASAPARSGSLPASLSQPAAAASAGGLLSRRPKRSITILDPITAGNLSPDSRWARGGVAEQHRPAPGGADRTTPQRLSEPRDISRSLSQTPQHIESSPFLASRTLQRQLEQHVQASALRGHGGGGLQAEPSDDSDSSASDGGQSDGDVGGAAVSHPLFPRDQTTNVYFGNLVSLQAEDGQFLTVDPRSGVVAFQSPTPEWERRGIEPFPTFAVASALQAWGGAAAEERSNKHASSRPTSSSLSARPQSRAASRGSHRRASDPRSSDAAVAAADSRRGADAFVPRGGAAGTAAAAGKVGGDTGPIGRVPTEGLPAGLAAKFLTVATQRTVASLIRAASMVAAAERTRTAAMPQRKPPPPPPAAPLYIFRVIDITEPKSTAALQYGCNLWLQVVAGNGSAGWVSGSILGVHVARPTELSSISQGIDQHGDVGPNGSALPPGLLDITLQEALVQNKIRESVQETEQSMRAAQFAAKSGNGPPAMRQSHTRTSLASPPPGSTSPALTADGTSPGEGKVESGDNSTLFLTQSSSVQMVPPQGIELGDSGLRRPEDTPASDDDMQPLTRHTAMNAPPPETTVGAIALYSSAPSATKRRPRREINHDPELRDMLSPSTAWNTDVALARVGDAALMDEQSTWSEHAGKDSAQEAVAASAMLPLLNAEAPPRSAASQWQAEKGPAAGQVHGASKGGMLVVRPTRSTTRSSRRRNRSHNPHREAAEVHSARGSVASGKHPSPSGAETAHMHEITGFAANESDGFQSGGLSGRSSAARSESYRSARDLSPGSPPGEQQRLGSPRVLAVTGPPHIPTYASSAIEAAILSNVQRKRRMQFLAGALDVAGDDLGVPRPIPAVVPGKGVVTSHTTGVLMGEPSAGNAQGVYTFGTPSFMALVENLNMPGRLVGKWTVSAAMRTHPSNADDAGSAGLDKKRKQKRHKGRYEESSSEDDNDQEGVAASPGAKAPQIVSKREKITRANQRDVRNMDWIVLSHGSLFLAAHPHEGGVHASLVRDGERLTKAPQSKTTKESKQDSVVDSANTSAAQLPAGQSDSLTDAQRNLLGLLRPGSRMAHLCMHSLRFLQLTSQSSAAHQAAMWRRIHMTAAGKGALGTLDEVAQRRHALLGRRLHFALQDGFTEQVRARALAKSRHKHTEMSGVNQGSRPSASPAPVATPARLLPRGSSFRVGSATPSAFGQALKRSPSKGSGQMKVFSKRALGGRRSSKHQSRSNKVSWRAPAAAENDLSFSAMQGVQNVEGDDSDSDAGSDSSTATDALGLDGDDTQGGTGQGQRGLPSALSAADSVPHSGPRGRFMVPLRGMLRIRLVAVSESSAVGGSSLQLAAAAAAAATAGQQPARSQSRSEPRSSPEKPGSRATSRGAAADAAASSDSRGGPAAHGKTHAPSLSAVVNTVAARSAGAGMSAPVGQFELLAGHQLAQSRLQRRGRSKRQENLSTQGYTGSAQTLLHGSVGGVAAAARGEAQIASTTRMQLLPDVQRGQHRSMLLRQAAAKRRTDQEAAAHRRRARGKVDPSVSAMKGLLRKVHRAQGQAVDTPANRDTSFSGDGGLHSRASSFSGAWGDEDNADSEEDVAAAVARGMREAAMEHCTLRGGRHLAGSIMANNDTALKIANADFVEAVMQQQEQLQAQAQREVARSALSPGVPRARGAAHPWEGSAQAPSIHRGAGGDDFSNQARASFAQQQFETGARRMHDGAKSDTWVVPGTPAHRLASLNRYIDSAAGPRSASMGYEQDMDHARTLSFVLRGEHGGSASPGAGEGRRPITSNSSAPGSSMYLTTAGALFQQDEQVARQLREDELAQEAEAQALAEASVPATVRAAQQAMHHAREEQEEDRRVKQLHSRQERRQSRAREADDMQLQERDAQTGAATSPAATRENTAGSTVSRAGDTASSQPGRRVPVHGTAAHVEHGVMSPDNIASILDSIPVAMRNSWEHGLRSELDLEKLVQDMREQSVKHLSTSPDKMRSLRSAIGRRELPPDIEAQSMAKLRGAQASHFAQHLQNEDTRMHVLLGIESESRRAKGADALDRTEESPSRLSPAPRFERPAYVPTAKVGAVPQTRAILQSLQSKLDEIKSMP